MSIAGIRHGGIRHMDDDRQALYTGTILLALARLRFEVRLVALAVLLLLVAFVAHVVFFAAR